MSRDEHLEAAVNALQEALFLAGSLYTTTAATLNDIALLHAALDRARVALRASAQKGGA